MQLVLLMMAEPLEIIENQNSTISFLKAPAKIVLGIGEDAFAVAKKEILELWSCTTIE